MAHIVDTLPPSYETQFVTDVYSHDHEDERRMVNIQWHGVVFDGATETTYAFQDDERVWVERWVNNLIAKLT